MGEQVIHFSPVLIALLVECVARLVWIRVRTGLGKRHGQAICDVTLSTYMRDCPRSKGRGRERVLANSGDINTAA